MPTIGKPDTGTNPFSKIKMNRGPVEGKEIGDKLNKVIGRDEMNRVADRLIGGAQEQRELFRPAPVQAMDDRARLRITPEHFA